MERLRFLHIPKTAGTTVTEALRLVLRAGGRRTFMFYTHLKPDRERYQRLTYHQRGKIRLFTGHAPRQTGIEDADRAPTLTFLRDPVARLKSHCQYIFDGNAPDLEYKFPPGRFEASELLNSGLPMLENLQTRFLIGDEFYRLPDGRPGELVDQAFKVLSQELAAFGIVEEFEDSMLHFYDRLNWPRMPVYQKANARPPNVKLLEFTKLDEARLRDLNQLDLELYARAGELFRQRLGTGEERDEQKEKTIRRFQRKQKQAKVLFKTANALRRLRGRKPRGGQ